ncbi:MAG: hypothetical protein KDK99_08130 [Verrucomicrobiales bacterium]|nr:hypothetical protein [Verrucomicrobiales bacterium]
MKSRLLFQLAAAALLTGILASCAAPVERRITHNPELFSQLSSEDQALVRQGKLREGMTKEAVFLAAGRPNRVESGRKAGKSYERWTYEGQRPVWINNYGAGWGGWGWGGWGGPYCNGGLGGWYNQGPSVAYVPYDAASVDFVNEKVVGWSSSPKE